jgi:hypothetical protein
VTGALVAVQSAESLLAQERRQAEEANNAGPMTRLASFVRDRWSVMKRAREQDVDTRLLQCLRQRRGEYDPQTLAAIRRQGGSEVYMRLSANKSRAASAWIRDTLSATDGPLPYSLEPTPVPELPPERLQMEHDKFFAELQQAEAAGIDPQPWDLQMFVEARTRMIENTQRDTAKEQAEAMKRRMDDQMVEGGIVPEFGKFIDDITTFPYALMKGPVVEKRQILKWVAGENGATLETIEALRPVWKRVSPFDFYWMPHMEQPDDGDVIERHRLTRAALSNLIGAPGYNDAAIRAVLDEYGRGGLHEWLSLDQDRAIAEGKPNFEPSENTSRLIDALQFWGSVQGSLLLEWGIPNADLAAARVDGKADPLAEYPVEIWLVGRWVVKAVINPDMMGRKPYYKASYGEIPGAWAGESPMDLIRDCQAVCNATMRALVDNEGIASGPQMWVDIDRLPPGEDITTLYPWKIHQVRSDMSGTAQPPIGFFQPNSQAHELLRVYQEISVLADEYSGIPRYMTGDGSAGGAGRTATGMSMMMNNAGKTIKQVIANIDRNVIAPLVERLWYYNMKYADDQTLKGDVAVVARGAGSLVIKDAAAVRRNELLQMALQSPVVQQVIGMEGIAYMLREQAKTLDMNADRIVPPEEVVKARAMLAQVQQQAMMAQQAAMGGGPPGMPGAPEAQMPVPGGPGEVLQDGATPVADNFSPVPAA